MRVKIEVQINHDGDNAQPFTVEHVREYFTDLCGEGENPHVLKNGAEVVMECVEVEQVPES